jgi:hypothetical protein
MRFIECVVEHGLMNDILIKLRATGGLESSEWVLRHLKRVANLFNRHVWTRVQIDNVTATFVGRFHDGSRRYELNAACDRVNVDENVGAFQRMLEGVSS